MNVSLLFYIFCLSGCTSPSQKDQSPEEHVSVDALLLGRWETDRPQDICVRFSKEDRMEISFQRHYHPKHRVYGTRKQLEKENNQYTFQFTPTEIFQEKYVRPCRKKIFRSEDLDETRLLRVPMAIEQPLDILVEYLPPEDKLKFCLSKLTKADTCFQLTRTH